jgi:hypothetical protein
MPETINPQSIIKPVDSIYTYFDREDDIIEGQRKIITEGVFTGDDGAGDGELEGMYTSSTQAALSSSNYYLNVYQTDPGESEAEVQFDVSYGTASQYGGADEYLAMYEPAYATYHQYKNLLLARTDTAFPLYNGGSTDNICIINFKRDKIKEGLDAGNWEIKVTSGSDEITLIDNSSETNAAQPDTNLGVGRAYYIVSGTIDGGVHTTPGDFGIAYLDLGILVFNAPEVEAAADTYSGDDPDGTIASFSLNISSSCGEDGFIARNEEEITSTHYFVRVKNKKFNFTNNPSWVTGSYGTVKHEEMWGDPITYITTVGMYDDKNNLLAVAKLNRPVLKSFEREILVKVQLNY